MSESKVSLTEGSGKNLRTFDRTISSVLVQEQVFQHGEPYLPTYSVSVNDIAASTTASHVLQIMAGSSLHVRITAIRIMQYGLAGTASTGQIDICRLTTAGTGGTAVTPRPYDSGDAAAGATAMTLPSSKGTEGVLLMHLRLPMVAAQPMNEERIWRAGERAKPIIIPAGTSNGIALKNLSGIATSTSWTIDVEFTETAWL